MALLFPAYAGVIPTTPAPSSIKTSFPRPRGGDPYIDDLLTDLQTFSPPCGGDSSNSPSSDIHDNFSPPMRGFYIDNPAQKADNRLILNAERGKVYAVF